MSAAWARTQSRPKSALAKSKRLVYKDGGRFEDYVKRVWDATGLRNWKSETINSKANYNDYDMIRKHFGSIHSLTQNGGKSWRFQRNVLNLCEKCQDRFRKSRKSERRTSIFYKSLPCIPMLNRLARREHFGLFLNGDEWKTGCCPWRHDVNARLEVDDERRYLWQPIECSPAAARCVARDQIFHFRDDVDEGCFHVESTDFPGLLR